MSGKEIVCRTSKAPANGLYTDTVKIGNLGLMPGQKMSYIFDFGDMWKFDVLLLDIDKDKPLPLHPQIEEYKGDSPEQYPDLDACDE